MLGLSFVGLSFPQATLATRCSRFCWKRLQKNLGLIKVVDSSSHVKLRPLNAS
ncbi:hypothetical protein GLYMA_17G142180v4 [Glycine max]|nr:hypothetical protein GLYMA_17G142180v4 [Glycine max]